jgi:predicted transcriptional regulator
MDRLNEQRTEGDRQTGYTTVLKFVQIMTEKGLLVRDDRQRTHVFHPAHPPGDVQDKLVGDLVDRAFGASAHKLVMHALASRKVSSDELEEIRNFLDQIEKERT